MRKFVALALSAAVLVALPTTADARGWNNNGDRHHHRYRNYSYGSGYYPSNGYGMATATRVRGR